MNRYQKMNPLVWHRKQFGLALLVLLALVSARPLWRALAAAGDLDTTFGSNGSVLLPIEGAGSARMVIQHDGKVLTISANTVNPVTDDFTLVRMNLNGDVDTSFGGDGIVKTDFGGSGEKSADLAIQFNGRIVIVGATYQFLYGAPQLAIARYLPNGSLDTSFSENGKRIGIPNTRAFSVAFQPDNKIVVGGRYYTNFTAGESVPFLVRYNSNGSLDTSFGAQGYVFLPAGTGNEFEKIAVQSNGGILAANGQGIRRYFTSGFVDPFFGGSGILQENVTDFELLSDGKIVTLSYGDTFRRWLSSGFSDSSFNATALICESCSFTSFAVQENGQLVTVGAHPNFNATLARVNSNGGLDSNFGSGGYKEAAGSYFSDSGIALLADQRIVTAGREYIYPTFKMRRYQNDNTSTQTTDVSVGPITISPTTVNPGDTVTYTIPVKNLSTTKATHVTMKTNVPSGTTYVGTAVSGWAVLQQPSVGAMGTVSASAYELAPGATANLFVLVKVPATAAHGSTVSLSANVSNTITETANLNNYAFKVFTVQ